MKEHEAKATLIEQEELIIGKQGPYAKLRDVQVLFFSMSFSVVSCLLGLISWFPNLG